MDNISTELDCNASSKEIGRINCTCTYKKFFVFYKKNDMMMIWYESSSAYCYYNYLYRYMCQERQPCAVWLGNFIELYPFAEYGFFQRDLECARTPFYCSLLLFTLLFYSKTRVCKCPTLQSGSSIAQWNLVSSLIMQSWVKIPPIVVCHLWKNAAFYWVCIKYARAYGAYNVFDNHFSIEVIYFFALMKITKNEKLGILSLVIKVL